VHATTYGAGSFIAQETFACYKLILNEKSMKVSHILGVLQHPALKSERRNAPGLAFSVTMYPPAYLDSSFL
jgi:hypothetical protein